MSATDEGGQVNAYRDDEWWDEVLHHRTERLLERLDQEADEHPVATY